MNETQAKRTRKQSDNLNRTLARLVREKQLRLSAMHVAMRIDQTTDGSGIWSKGVEALAVETGLSTKAISLALVSLVRHGIIEKRFQGNRPSVFRLVYSR